MIYEALSCVAKEMNEFMRAQLKISDDKVIISGIVNQDGTIAVQGENKVLLTLLNIEKETYVKNNAPQQGNKVSQGAVNNAVNINLLIMFAAYFNSTNYTEALRFVSYVISFMQQKNVFTNQNTPALDRGIEKLVFEIENLGAERLNNTWATIGAKYMPSVYYKMRMITFSGFGISELRPVIGEMRS